MEETHNSLEVGLNLLGKHLLGKIALERVRRPGRVTQPL